MAPSATSTEAAERLEDRLDELQERLRTLESRIHAIEHQRSLENPAPPNWPPSTFMRDMCIQDRIAAAGSEPHEEHDLRIRALERYLGLR